MLQKEEYSIPNLVPHMQTGNLTQKEIEKKNDSGPVMEGNSLKRKRGVKEEKEKKYTKIEEEKKKELD